MNCEHSVEVDVSRDFAWNYWTDIRNWSDPPATFALDGPFAPGSRGTTTIPGQEPLSWTLGPIEPGTSGTVQMPLDRAMISFRWAFEPIAEERTRITQRVEVTGENPASYSAALEIFRSNLPPGMQRIADAMTARYRSMTRGIGML
jgi:hypothetical protein